MVNLASKLITHETILLLIFPLLSGDVPLTLYEVYISLWYLYVRDSNNVSDFT